MARATTDTLAIRFHPNEGFTRLDVCPPQATNDTWTLWSHAWSPASPGRYGIVLKVLDPAIPTRRLDVYFYARPIWVEEVN